MKKISLGLIDFIVALLFVFTSCNSVDKKAALIPKDAAFVIHLNTKSLSSKLSWEEIKQTNWFRDVSSGHNDSLAKKILDDPDNSGINTNEGFVIFGKPETSHKGFLIGLSGNIKDVAAFEAFNKKISKTENVTSNDNLKTIRFKEKGAVSWNENKFLYLFEQGLGYAIHSRMNDSGQVYQEPAPLDLSEIAKRIFNYKKDSLLIDDDRFVTLMKEEGDVHFWVNAETAYGSGSSMGVLSFLKMDVYFRESVTASTLSFDKGRIAVHAKSYSNKEMRELFKKYAGGTINTNLVKRIPSDSVIGVVALNYKPEGLKEFLKLGGLDGMVNSFFGKFDITLDDLVAATKGDLVIAVTDVGLKKHMISLGPGMDSLPTNAPSANFIFATSIGNKAAFNKLEAATKKLREGGDIPSGIFTGMNNELFVAGSSQAVVDEYLRGGNKDFPFLGKISDHPAAFYLDLNKLIRSFHDQVKDSSASRAYEATVQMWKDMVANGG